MADFVAVIKRAVDGLSEKTPAMRARVYDKARIAVRRQLEGMTPRPSDAAIDGQLAKLESAIDTVEAEHAEPVLDDLVFEDLEPEEEPDPPPAPDEVEPADEDHAPVAQDEPETPGEGDSYGEPAAAPPDEASDMPKPAGPTPVPFGSYAIGRAATFPVRPAARPDETPPPATDGFQPSRNLPGFGSRPVPEEDGPRAEAEAEPVDETALPPAEPVAAIALDAEPADAETAAEDYLRSEAQPSHFDAVDDSASESLHVGATTGERPEWAAEPPFEAGPDDESAFRPEDEILPIDAAGQDGVAPDGAADVEPLSPLEQDRGDPGFPVSDEDHWRPTFRDAAGQGEGSVDRDNHDNAFGFAPAGDRLAGQAGPGDEAAAAGAPAAPYERQRKGRGRMVAGLVALLLIGGAAYAAWSNQDRLMALFSPEPAMEDLAAPAEEEPAAETPDEPAEDVAAADPEPPVEPEEAPAEPSDFQKFTQRLLPDGTEIDEGPAAVPEQPVPGEGRSLAMQSDDAAADDEATPPETSEEGAEGEITEEDIAQSEVAEDGAVAAEAEADDAAADESAAIGVGQTMFLYEERLGQRGPTALEGSVVWSMINESPGGDAVPEAAIRAEVNVPDKDLTALVTIRRNNDDSLPASHLIEIVFSLPSGFEGGGIDTVQRVAFKTTEEDRGNELIAVPAKITDDFFMIALNDYAEAVSTNLQLMRERDWIDIPVVYGNGRRALITLDKGATGSDIFDRALSDWQRRTGSSAG